MTTIQFDKDTADSITALSRHLMTNLCKEIIIHPFVPSEHFTMNFKIEKPVKYKFSREWLIADFDWVHQAEVLEWCAEYFGPHPKNPDAWSRWYNKYSERIHFRDEKDYLLFVLRWS